jgi:hypothetical protein
MVHKDEVLEIFNSQNKEKISLSDVEGLLKKPRKNFEEASVCPFEDYFVNKEILENGEFDLLLEKKARKPFYVPEKQELLKYMDDLYFEKTNEYKALLKYTSKHFFKGEEEKAEWLCEDIYDICHVGPDLKNLLETYSDRVGGFKDMAQAEEVLHLIVKLSNNVRRWEHNGYTSQETLERSEKSNSRSIRGKPFEFSGDNVIDMKTRKKIGRNDPCPCGSGKKYKNCCLVKEE